ncbi:hypothetical protein COCNU_07G001290 [Cocos nucifera]|uniref:Uncharacterized protein n=1 Tax=Cocos nucifera TaxID=13894 RepID=A0A8K0IEI5_COCNU|nr:hypothetical protein COCNU_07G001290 [Cocos nucifera]
MDRQLASEAKQFHWDLRSCQMIGIYPRCRAVEGGIMAVLVQDRDTDHASGGAIELMFIDIVSKEEGHKIPMIWRLACHPSPNGLVSMNHRFSQHMIVALLQKLGDNGRPFEGLMGISSLVVGVAYGFRCGLLVFLYFRVRSRRREEKKIRIRAFAEGISSPIVDRILEFYDDGGDDLFPSDLQPLLSSDVAVAASSAAAAVAFSPVPSIDTAALSTLLDDPQPSNPEHDFLPADVDCTSPSDPSSMFPAPPQHVDQHQVVDPFDPIVSTDPILGGGYLGYSSESVVPIQIRQQQQQAPMFVGLESAVQSPSCAFLDGGGIGAFHHQAGMGGEGQPGLFSAGMTMVGSGQEVVEYQRMVEGAGNVGIYGPDSLQQRVYGFGDMQQVIGGNQHLMGGCIGSPTQLPASDISALEESTFKVGRLSTEERKEKIHRYMKKRNERNFSKKIKVVVKEEDIFDSPDILAHISGVNSFKYNYTLESWI